MYGLQEHEMRFYCLFKKVYFSLLATSDFFCRHAYAYAHMRIIRHETAIAAYAWPSLVPVYQVYQEDQDQISDATYISDVVFDIIIVKKTTSIQLL